MGRTQSDARIQDLISNRNLTRNETGRIDHFMTKNFFFLIELGETLAYICKVGQYEELNDEYGGTQLLWAAGHGHEAVVQLLIKRDDVDINAKNDLGRTHLSVVANQRHEAVVQLLVKKDNAKSL